MRPRMHPLKTFRSGSRNGFSCSLELAAQTPGFLTLRRSMRKAAAQQLCRRRPSACLRLLTWSFRVSKFCPLDHERRTKMTTGVEVICTVRLVPAAPLTCATLNVVSSLKSHRPTVELFFCSRALDRRTIQRFQIHSPRGRISPSSKKAKTRKQSQVKAIGFDMDYTLAQYFTVFDQLAFDGSKVKLVEDLGYPEEVHSFTYDPEYFSRGLVIDLERGEHKGGELQTWTLLSLTLTLKVSSAFHRTAKSIFCP